MLWLTPLEVIKNQNLFLVNEINSKRIDYMELMVHTALRIPTRKTVLSVL